MHKEEHFTKGMFYMLLTFLTVAIMSALGKVAAADASSIIIVFFQNAIGFLVAVPLILKRGLKATFYTQRIGTHIFRAFTGTTCWYCLFFAIKLLSLNTAVLLIYSAPLWMPIMGHLFFKEKSHPKVWIGVIVGFIGIALVLQIHNLKVFENYGVLVGLAGGILLALALFAVRWLGKTEHPTTVLAYYLSLATLMVAPFALPNFNIDYKNWHLWTALIGVGVMLALGQLLLIKAFQYASAIKLSPFIYSIIPFTAIIDAIFWHTIPDAVQILGMLLVIIGGIFAMRANVVVVPKESDLIFYQHHQAQKRDINNRK